MRVCMLDESCFRRLRHRVSRAFRTPEPKVLPVQVADIAGGTYPAVVQILAGTLSASGVCVCVCHRDLNNWDLLRTAHLKCSAVVFFMAIRLQP
jgi:hypothetical protein